MFPLLYIGSEYALFLARVIVGVILVVHGWPKLKDIKGTAGWMGDLGFRPGIVFASIAVAVEFFGGIVLIGGLLVQPVALLLVVQFAILAVWKIAYKKPLANDLEIDLMMFALGLILATVGGGAFALDRMFFRPY